MQTAYVVVTVIAAVFNGFSGLVALVRPRALMPRLDAAMAQAGVPVSWSRFPIGTFKLTGAAGLTIGLATAQWVAIAAAIGLVLFWVCAVYIHMLAGDYSPTLALAGGFFLPLSVTTLALGVLTL